MADRLRRESGMNFSGNATLAPVREPLEPLPLPTRVPGPSSPAPAVEVSHLRKAYKTVRAVDDISFTVEPGEMLGLLGPNGAGKTTTLQMILGLRPPDAGSVRICGLEVKRSDDRYKTMIGAQLQRTEFPVKWTTFDVLDLFAAFYPNPFPPMELLERFGLQEKRNARVETLSGGQLQRLGLAVALVGRPKVVCMDEPTNGLDAHARRSLWELIQELQRSGLTLLLTTHSMEEAERLCDRVAIIDGGRILAIDSPQRLIQRHFPERALQIETDSEFTDVRLLEQLPSVSRVQQGAPGQFTLFTAEPVPALTALLEFAAARELRVANVQIRTATLEDVFLDMTGRRIAP